MLIKIIIFITINLISTSGAFSVEVGDTVTYILREILQNGKVHKSFFTYRIDNYDKVTNKFLKTLEYHEEGHGGYSYQYWYSPSDFPTYEEIDDLLKNCENLGWKKDTVKVKAGPNEGVKVFDVCKTTKALYPIFPVNADIFYYGHFPIYGVVKAEYSSDNSSFYSDNLMTD